MWSDRLAWAGEIPAQYPDLNPVALSRFDDGYNGTWQDAIDPSHIWAATPWDSDAQGISAGPWGPRLGLSLLNPATDKARLQLPNFAGLWPSSGRLLQGMWVSQQYTMTFNPLMSSRGGSGAPLAYLSSHTNGSFRHQVYSSSGSLVLDKYETPTWGESETRFMWVGQLLDLTARTSQLCAINFATHQAWLSPVRTLSGAPNASCTAPLDVAALPTAGYWTGGYFDEVLVAHPGASFQLAEFVERMRRGTWATGSSVDASGKLRVSDQAVTVEAAHLLRTGAEQVAWTLRPEPSRANAVPYWSTDNGTTWQTGAQLPASFSGLLRWEIPLAAGETFTGLVLLPPAPTLDEIATQLVPQRGSTQVQLRATVSGAPSWTVAAVDIEATISGSTLTLSAGWAAGDIPVTVTVRDEYGRAAARTFIARVEPPAWAPPQPPQYPRVPLVVHGGDDGGDVVAIIDELEAVATSELNGERYLEFALPVKHRHAALLQPELVVEVAGDVYRIRRIKTARRRGVPVYEVYAEARFYDLAYSGQVDGRELLQATAGDVIELALAGTGWTVAAVNVTSRRTYTIEDSTPLELLRTVQEQHGGDLLFDNVSQTVSLVVQSGRDVGVSFFYGKNVAESSRVVDTTSLITRIYARNAEGVTIAGVNGGLPYLEDYTYTDEVREATYDFASGASPYTMLSMARATLANRSKPSYSYQFTVADTSAQTGQQLDRFDVGDTVTVVDDELGMREQQRIVKVQHDIVEPWASKITLSGKLRELGSDRAAQAGALTTGASNRAFNLVPYNLLKNGRFDSALSHWAASGVEIVDGGGTGDYAVRFDGAGTRWIEQTVQPDNRSEYALSLDVTGIKRDEGLPPLRAIVTVEYDDGSSESIPVDLA